MARIPATTNTALEEVVLAPDELARLVELLDGDPEMTELLRSTLARLSDAEHRPPELTWPAR